MKKTQYIERNGELLVKKDEIPACVSPVVWVNGFPRKLVASEKVIYTHTVRI